MPILTYGSLPEVPEALRSIAKSCAFPVGGYQVEVVPALRLDEFREANIAITKENHTLKTENAALKLIDEAAESVAAKLREVQNAFEIACAERDTYKAACKEHQDTANEALSEVALLAEFIRARIGLQGLRQEAAAIDMVHDIVIDITGEDDQ
ncbi:hypothetical protein CcrC1_gp108 [Caulobacter phage C1]|nr:hypothetical protein CcrC1_gp108 [Caulobacter phage C1]UTU08336.1 hypothetical protein CcrC2_gp108 [Caulobacter phage C2]UTU08856.1 hypothetical protein CcrJ4_gp105 [Caulobacter phage J4]UTU09410.1 hypothetical protein CcrBL47_gp124 [Caulobacter phage BL47]UTU09970.1 hypothetical protein CcrRB23_gp108 [Caulobacter phage RB23]WGN96995.1 hypothetical protein [Bertelyvirus sp.]